MGEVYAAEDTRLQRQVALKLLPPDMAADAERLQRFQREARAVAALNHPNVVTVYSVEEDRGVQFLTMELVEGRTLSDVIPTDGLPLEILLKLAVPLVEAVAFAHEHGIIHRDLKPANVMIAGDERVKVLDFGLAKLKRTVPSPDETTELATATLTRHHAIIGTAAYMSPEQAEGRMVDHRSDIFSLGVILYEMASGRRPFSGDTDVSLISSIIKDSPQPLSEVKRDVPPTLERVIAKALAKDPAQRHQSAGKLRADLLAGSGGGAGDSAGWMKIYSVPAGGGPAVLTTSDKATDWSPVWAPDGEHLYFVSDRGGSMNLWRVAIDEESGRPLSEPVPIITPAPFLAHPSVSADGRRIAYTAVSETQNIQRLALDPATLTVTGEPGWVTSGSRMWANPDPTPDGEWVVFYSRDQPEGDVYVCRPDGTGLRQLTRDKAVDRVPRWSPDSTWVAFFSDRGGRLQIWKIRAADASDLQQMTDAGTIPAWSPDSRRLATASAFSGTDRVSMVVDADRQAKDQAPDVLPTADEAIREFIPISWSPDGTTLAGQVGFSDRRGAGIVRYAFASRTYERLTDFGEWPAWFSDSRRILFVSRGREFWVLDTRTKQTKKIYSTVWHTLGPPRLTRDGRAVFFSRRVTEGDIYLLSFE